MISVKCSHCGEPFGWFHMIKSIFTKFEIKCSHCKKHSQVTKRARSSINVFCMLIPCLAGVVSLNIFIFIGVYGTMILTSPIFLKYEKQRKQ